MNGGSQKIILLDQAIPIVVARQLESRLGDKEIQIVGIDDFHEGKFRGTHDPEWMKQISSFGVQIILTNDTKMVKDHPQVRESIIRNCLLLIFFSGRFAQKSPQDQLSFIASWIDKIVELADSEPALGSAWKIESRMRAGVDPMIKVFPKDNGHH